MLDSWIRKHIQGYLQSAGFFFYQKGLFPNVMTFFAILFGLSSALLIIYHCFYMAFAFILLHRIADGLDGAIAHYHKRSDFGGALDNIGDFVVNAAIIAAFGIAYPLYSPWIHLLSFVYMFPVTAFLAYAIVAQKHQRYTEARGVKSFFYIWGICEGTETTLLLLAMTLFPASFLILTQILIGLSLMTGIQRTVCLYRDFPRNKQID